MAKNLPLTPPEAYAGRGFSREDVLTGKFKVYFGPDQPLDFLTYYPPQDWLPDGAPLMVPNVVMFTIVYPPWMCSPAIKMSSHWSSDRPPFYYGPGEGFHGDWAGLDPTLGGWDYFNFYWSEDEPTVGDVWPEAQKQVNNTSGVRSWRWAGVMWKLPILSFLEKMRNIFLTIRTYFEGKNKNIFFKVNEFYTLDPQMGLRVGGSVIGGPLNTGSLIGVGEIVQWWNGVQAPAATQIDTQAVGAPTDLCMNLDNTYTDSFATQPWALAPPAPDFFGCNVLHFYFGPYVENSPIGGMDGEFYAMIPNPDGLVLAGARNLKCDGFPTLEVNNMQNFPKFIQAVGAMRNVYDVFPRYKTIIYGMPQQTFLPSGSFSWIPRIDEAWNFRRISTVSACELVNSAPNDQIFLGYCDCTLTGLPSIYIPCDVSGRTPALQVQQNTEEHARKFYEEMSDYLTRLNALLHQGPIKIAELMKAEGFDYEYRGTWDAVSFDGILSIIREVFPEVA